MTPPLDRAAHRPKFVICAPTFSEAVGGTIVLHLLCQRLNEMGETALIWPIDRPLPRLRGNPRLLLSGLKYAATGRAQHYSIGPFNNRLASRRDVKDAIVVYPEIVAGNPLGARHVVRWLLYKPGGHTGIVDYGDHDLFFFALDVYNDPAFNTALDQKLDLVWFNSAYQDEGLSHREGSCYLMRKGAGRALVHDKHNSILIDGLSHEEKAREFNRRAKFYSYDLYTMYSLYAVMCGCISIVVPQPGVSKLEWRPREEDRFGLAYGEDDIPWALETRGKLLERVRMQRQAEDEMMQRFVGRCMEWYEASRRSEHSKRA